MKLILLLLLLPASLLAQEVKPVISPDYIKKVVPAGDKAAEYLTRDTTNSMRRAFHLSRRFYDGYSTVNRIEESGNSFRIKTVRRNAFAINGNFATSIELQDVNRPPALQSDFVQGRTVNGQLTWQGPETGEVFSYGPAIHTLHYDGSAYPYDVKGRLTENAGAPATAYDNPFFQTGIASSLLLRLQGRYLVNGIEKAQTTIKFSNQANRLIIPSNRNKNNSFYSGVDFLLKPVTLAATYRTLQTNLSNGTRNGFLNHLYASALLTPPSFENAQGTMTGTGQRSYSPAMNNPLFLLEDNDNYYSQNQHSGSLSAEKKNGSFRFKVAHSMEDISATNNEVNKAGSSFLPGRSLRRVQNDFHYRLGIAANKTNDYSYRYEGDASLQYFLNEDRTAISYFAGDHYSYQRSSQDVLLSYKAAYRINGHKFGATASNKFYISNSNQRDNYFLPAIGSFIELYEPFHLSSVRVELSTNFSQSENELPLNQSFAFFNLLQYRVEDANEFLPQTEVASLRGLQAIHHNEWSSTLRVSAGSHFEFTTELFTRTITGDVFPVLSPTGIQLKNLADHRNRGFLFSAGYSSNFSRGSSIFSHSVLGISGNNDKVIALRGGAGEVRVAGFKDVHISLVEGQRMGTIIGSRYSRSNDGAIRIGSDGYPLMDATPGIIGNANPDFTIKLNQSLRWKRLSLNIDAEWDKGGEVWNGTQAALDYYGRSATSGKLRSTTNYIFDAVDADGHPNTIPVNFYDPSQPLESNRWVRDGITGIAEEYVQPADHIVINNIGLEWDLKVPRRLQSIKLALYASNLVLWTRYKGSDPRTLLMDQPDTSGLDYFNIPSFKAIGFSASLQF